jgi:hypothetical protein
MKNYESFIFKFEETTKISRETKVGITGGNKGSNLGLPEGGVITE